MFDNKRAEVVDIQERLVEKDAVIPSNAKELYTSLGPSVKRLLANFRVGHNRSVSEDLCTGSSGLSSMPMLPFVVLYFAFCKALLRMIGTVPLKAKTLPIPRLAGRSSTCS